MSSDTTKPYTSDEFDSIIQDSYDKNMETEKLVQENREIRARIANQRLKIEESQLNKISDIKNSLENESLTDRTWDRNKMKKDIEDRRNAVTFINKKISKDFIAAPGSLMLIPSMTNNGKSTLTAQIAETLISEGKRVLVLSNEEKETDIRARISCLRTNISFGRYKTSNCSLEEEMRILDDSDLIAHNNSLVVISTSSEKDAYMVTTVNGVMSTLKKARGNFDAVLIDYFTNVNMGETTNEDPWHVNNKLASELNIFKDTSPFPIMVMAQCEGIKSDKKTADKSNLDFDSNHPMYRWKGGKGILLYATDIIELTKDFENSRSYLFAHKVRFSHGTLERLHELFFDKRMQRFVESNPILDAMSVSDKVKRLESTTVEEDIDSIIFKNCFSDANEKNN